MDHWCMVRVACAWVLGTALLGCGQRGGDDDASCDAADCGADAGSQDSGQSGGDASGTDGADDGGDSGDDGGDTGQGDVTLILPLEVLGPDGTEVCGSFALGGAAPYALEILLHHLTYADKAVVTINGGASIPVNETTATLEARAVQSGGFGGGMDLFRIGFDGAQLQSGANEICFRYDRLRDDDVSIGYRVVDLAVTDADGQPALEGVGYEDPSTWQPPSDDPADIGAGEQWWRDAALINPVGGGVPMQARCADCHAQDGRDLKYFNFSNHAIVERAVFHGLSREQGEQIASYVRTLDAPQSLDGRPFNPPYQPAPGLDARPVQEWAAGGGVGAVLDTWSEMTDELFPSGISADAMAQTPGNPNLNMREKRLALPLLDWFHWLPHTHPKDTVFADAFAGSGLVTGYQSLRGSLVVGDATGAYNAFAGWRGDKMDFIQETIGVGAAIWGSTPQAVRSRLRYDVAIWATVKQWELMQEFELEEQGTAFFGNVPTVEQRTWVQDFAFRNATNFTNLENGDHSAILNGTNASMRYVNFAWYYLQLVLNTGQGLHNGNRPIDWKYFHGRMKFLNSELGMHGTGIVHFVIIAKALQVFQIASPDGNPDWEFDDMQIWRLGNAESFWEGTDRRALISALLPVYVAQVESFTPQQFYNSGDSDFSATNTDTSSNNGRDALARTWEAAATFAALGVDPAPLAGYAAWAESIWPNLDWSAQAGL